MSAERARGLYRTVRTYRQDSRTSAQLARGELATPVAEIRYETDDAVWLEMRRHFNDAEIVEISLACAMFNMINRLNDSFRTELEPEEYNRRQHGAVGVTAQALEAYACRICAGLEA